jgi:hypothetical protein
MNSALLIAAAASLLVTAANAQAVISTTGTGNAATKIEPQYRTKIKSYVTQKKARPGYSGTNGGRCQSTS